MSFSDYYSSLSGDLKLCYGKKIEIIDNVDPYNIQVGEFSQDLSFLPKVLLIDLYDYLICTHSFYTGEQLKKLVQDYKHETTVIQDVLGKKINQDAFVVVAKVKHSPEMIEFTNIWIVILKEGDISCAHCTCMAGLDEVCSHVASFLFHLVLKPLGDEACTEVHASRPDPSEVNVRIRDMEWAKCRSGRPVQQPIVKEITKEELHAMIRKFQDLGYTPAIARVMEPFASEIAKKNEMKNLPL